MHNFIERFQFHQSAGLRVDLALDIGSYRGEFTSLLRAFWPTVKVWQFEADERQRKHNPDALYVLLGDSERTVDFYTIDEATAPATGSSIYRENTAYYANPILNHKKMTTIDALMGEMDFSGDWRNHGLIKIDTQGSELDILKGASRFLERFTPRAVLLEVSFVPYNHGAPLIADVMAYMQGIGYRAVDIFDLNYGANGYNMLLQADMYFERAG